MPYGSVESHHHPDSSEGCFGPFRVRFAPIGLLAPVLLRLLEGQPRTGFELLKEVGARTEGRWRPGPAAIYPTLRELEERGFVVRARRRGVRGGPYSLTEEGRRCMEDWEKLRVDVEEQIRTLGDLWNRL
jgi:DNA-binding PadR family transcriptional regulator